MVKNIHSKNLFIQKRSKIIHSKSSFIQKRSKIIHSKNLFIQKSPKLFIQRKYSFKWKMYYRPGLVVVYINRKCYIDNKHWYLAIIYSQCIILLQQSTEIHYMENWDRNSGVVPSPCFSNFLARTTFVLESLPEAKNPGKDAIFGDFVFSSYQN